MYILFLENSYTFEGPKDGVLKNQNINQCYYTIFNDSTKD